MSSPARWRRPGRLAALAGTAFWAAAWGVALAAPVAAAEPGTALDARIAALAAAEKPALLQTLAQLVAIESGSRDLDGLDRISALVADRLRALGGKVELIDPSADAYRMEDTPEKIGKIVRATFTGTGERKILLIAHMDTVYQIGMLGRQPFRIDGDKAYGLGVADDKQGIAVILHVLAMLRALDFKDYGSLTVLINGDEEISSPGARALLTQLGGESDVVLSYEGSSVADDRLTLATAGIAAVTLHITGKAAHAGSPQAGVNALYEMAYQVLQMRDLSDPATGLKLNWTVARSGTNRNVIPASATAGADVRVRSVADYERIEAQVRDHAARRMIPESRVDVVFERRRPPLQASDASRALAAHAQRIYRSLGRELGVDDQVAGDGTDAAFAGLKTSAAVIERFGLQSFGAHSPDAEYVLLDSIEPRLQLSTRMIIDVSRGLTGAAAP